MDQKQIINYQEDDKDNQIDHQIEVQIQNYRNRNKNARNNHRPESSYRINQTNKNTIHTKNHLQKLNNFITFHHISLEEFWRSHRITATREQFEKFLNHIGFDANQLFWQEMYTYLVQDNIIHIKRVCQEISYWYKKKDSITDMVRQRAMNIAQSSKKKLYLKKKQCQRPFSSIPHKKTTFELSHKQKELIKLLSHQANEANYQQTNYLKEYQSKQQKQKHNINKLIKDKKNQDQYEILVKLGEANQILEKLNQNNVYQVKRNQKGKLQIYRNGQKKMMPEFRKQFKKLQQRMKQKNNLKYCKILQLGQYANSKHVSRKLKPTNFDDKSQKKQDRQQQIQLALLQTLKLTIDLNRQLELFKAKGINKRNG